jgi:predicted SnoaL-like aldol condensation-catalyzing enzyme
MSSETAKNKDVVSRFYDDVFVGQDMSRIDEYMRDDYIQHNGDCPQGKAGFLVFFGTIFGAVPDFSYTLKKMVAEDDIVMAYRGGAINTITPRKITSENATGMVVSGFLVEVAKVTDEEWTSWRRDHPDAFERNYDLATGVSLSGWLMQ